MKSKKTFFATSVIELNSQDPWIQKQNFEQRIQQIKKPYLNRIEYSKLKIQNNIKSFEQSKKDLKTYEQLLSKIVCQFLNIQPAPAQNHKTITQQSEQSNHLNDKINQPKFLQQDSDEQKQNTEQKSSYLAEWPGRNKQKIFKNSTNMLEQYDKIFNKKIGTSHLKPKSSYSYRKSEKEMLQKIFEGLKNNHEETINFTQIYKFLQECNLFLTIYGINSSQIEDLVKCSAHNYSDKLTKKQFLQFFLINCSNRHLNESQNQIEKTCCLEKQNWDELKKLFNQLDTFGDRNISTVGFFHKMKTISASKELLEANVIYYPTLNKHYNIKKILFDLEHKKSLNDNLKWEDLESLITNFDHIDYPTIDQISAAQIQNAQIFEGSNAFFLKQQVLSIIKQKFQNCPKFCKYFVKCKYFCEDLLSSQDLKIYMHECVKKENSSKNNLINLQKTIKMLLMHGPEYFDMDQMLQYFSVKGFQVEINKKKFKENFDNQSSASDDEFQKRKQEKLKINRVKSLEKMEKIMNGNKRSQKSKEKKIIIKPTIVQQFNLTERRDHLTIREKKVIQMLQEKQRKQTDEIKPFVKANPIPVSNNCQKFQEQKQKTQLRRQFQRARSQKKRDQDNKKLIHLISNTKLFQKRDPLKVEKQRQKYGFTQPQLEFEAKPISWFVKQTNLLEVIQSEKKQRRKNRVRQTNEKYVFGYWKNLPYQDKQRRPLTIVEDLENKQESINGDLKKFYYSSQGNLKIKPVPVPDFAKLQQQFIEQLESKKKMRSPTMVKEFNLSVGKKTKIPSETQTSTVINRSVFKSSPSTELKDERPIIVGTTKKFQSMSEMNKLKREERQQELYIKKMEELERKQKQKVFAKYMQKVWKQEKKKNKNKTSRLSVSQRGLDEDSHEEELRQMYSRVLNRPFLFQQQESVLKSSRPKKANKSKPRPIRIPQQQNEEDTMRGFESELNEVQEQEEQYEGQEEEYYEEQENQFQSSESIETRRNHNVSF